MSRFMKIEPSFTKFLSPKKGGKRKVGADPDKPLVRKKEFHDWFVEHWGGDKDPEKRTRPVHYLAKNYSGTYKYYIRIRSGQAGSSTD